MKKTVCLVLAVLVLLSVSTLPGYVYGAGGHGGGGNWQGGGNWHGGGGNWHGGGGNWHGGGGNWHGGSIWIGPGWGSWWGGWGPWWGGWGPWWGAPAYPYYPYSPYYSAPGVVQQQPPVYVQPSPQAEEQSYWYYCPDSQAYYPYVKQCPKGWMKVVPYPVPQGEEE